MFPIPDKKADQTPKIEFPDKEQSETVTVAKNSLKDPVLAEKKSIEKSIKQFEGVNFLGRDILRNISPFLDETELVETSLVCKGLARDTLLNKIDTNYLEMSQLIALLPDSYNKSQLLEIAHKTLHESENLPDVKKKRAEFFQNNFKIEKLVEAEKLVLIEHQPCISLILIEIGNLQKEAYRLYKCGEYSILLTVMEKMALMGKIPEKGWKWLFEKAQSTITKPREASAKGLYTTWQLTQKLINLRTMCTVELTSYSPQIDFFEQLAEFMVEANLDDRSDQDKKQFYDTVEYYLIKLPKGILPDAHLIGICKYLIEKKQLDSILPLISKLEDANKRSSCIRKFMFSSTL